MKLIIAMAGAGSRFKNIGINIPKHEIVVHEKTLFEWSMLSLSNFFDEKFIFIVRQGFYNNSFIKDKCEELGIESYDIVEIHELTDGQATTVLYAGELINDDESVIIYNIDTYVKENYIKKEDIEDDFIGFIPVFNAKGDKWSFVKMDSNGNVIDVAEKRRISNLGSIGLYYFKSWNLYKEIYELLKNDIRKEFKETYIAPMYKRLVERGQKIGTIEIDSQNVHVLGTPEDVEEFKLFLSVKAYN